MNHMVAKSVKAKNKVALGHNDMKSTQFIKRFKHNVESVDILAMFLNISAYTEILLL